MEAVARRNPRHVDELAEIPELRRWQAEVLGDQFVKALSSMPATSVAAAAKAAPKSPPKSPPKLAATRDESPYKE